MQIDWSENEVEGLKVQSLPNMKLYQNANKDQPISLLHADKFDRIITALKQFTTFDWVDPPDDWLDNAIKEMKEEDRKFKKEQKRLKKLRKQ